MVILICFSNLLSTYFKCLYLIYNYMIMKEIITKSKTFYDPGSRNTMRNCT